MKNYLKDKGMFILHYRPLVLSSMLFAFCLFFCWILFPNRASSGPYLDSAHGNTAYGVNRSGLLTFGYSKGNCAHCHEQHASIGGSEPDPNSGSPSKYGLSKQLFTNQEDTFCFMCHKDSPKQISMPNQYNYSRKAGGDTLITCPLNIREVFQYVDISGNPSLNCNSNNGSSHFLEDIRSFLEKKSWGFTKGINPCSGCHNPHRAQKDPHTSTGRIVGGKLVSAVSLPSQHEDLTTWGLWGDDTLERMNRYYYQAPCRYPRSNPCTSYEPDGSATTDGSNLVDYVTFCLDCHKEAISGTTRYIPPIDWGINGDIHGAASQYCKCDYADKRNPYNDGINYVLSCLDCHEPHGSPNEYLLRQGVNGSHNDPFATHQYYNFCLSCHKRIDKHLGGISSLDSNDDCWGCHSHGATYPSTKLNRCTGCGSIDIKTF